LEPPAKEGEKRDGGNLQEPVGLADNALCCFTLDGSGEEERVVRWEEVEEMVGCVKQGTTSESSSRSSSKRALFDPQNPK